MKIRTILLLIVLLCNTILLAQAPSISWQKCIGTEVREVVKSIEPTVDGGFILAGTKGNYMYYDYYVIKLDASGAVEWEKTFGDQNNDQALSVKPTADGGYIVIGDSNPAPNIGGTYKGFWILKLNGVGEEQWQRTIGGGSLGMNDNTYDIQQTTDGGYVFTGIKFFPSKGGEFYIVKLDSTGAITWEKNYGGTADDYPNSIRQTTDGGYIVAGQAYSSTGDVTGQHGNGDFWIIKLDVAGNLTWQKALGGNGVDYATTIELTSDGGYIAAGFASSNSGDVSGVYGNADFWIVKIDSVGTIQWQKAFGGDNSDKPASVKPTLDGGYVVVGRTNSGNSGYVTGHHGTVLDIWVVKISASGAFQWQKCLGGNSDDTAAGILQDSDGSYLIAGSTFSNNTGDVTGFQGATDIWLVKLNPEFLATNEFETNSIVYPNPVSTVLNIHIPDAIEKVTVTDLTGKKVIEHRNTSGRVNVEQLQRGVYIIQIQTAQKSFTEKFIKD